MIGFVSFGIRDTLFARILGFFEASDSLLLRLGGISPITYWQMEGGILERRKKATQQHHLTPVTVPMCSINAVPSSSALHLVAIGNCPSCAWIALGLVEVPCFLRVRNSFGIGSSDGDLLPRPLGHDRVLGHDKVYDIRSWKGMRVVSQSLSCNSKDLIMCCHMEYWKL